jgi:hypothetical protein
VVPVFIGDTGSTLESAKTVSGGGGVGIFYVTAKPAPLGAGGGATSPAGSGLTSAQTTVGPALAAGAATQAAVPLAATPVASGSLAPSVRRAPLVDSGNAPARLHSRPPSPLTGGRDHSTRAVSRGAHRSKDAWSSGVPPTWTVGVPTSIHVGDSDRVG